MQTSRIETQGVQSCFSLHCALSLLPLFSKVAWSFRISVGLCDCIASGMLECHRHSALKKQSTIHDRAPRCGCQYPVYPEAAGDHKELKNVFYESTFPLSTRQEVNGGGEDGIQFGSQ